MTAQDTPKDAEFAAMQKVYEALNELEDDARSRVVTYIMDRLEITAEAPNVDRQGSAGGGGEDEAGLKQQEAAAPKYKEFAELYSAADPKTHADKALVAGYWLQVCQGAESFDSFSANKDLKHLGEGIENITAALTALKGQKPALVIQLKKSGKSQQARKTYKVTVAGIQAIEALING
jgi:hypothetical protein